MQDGSERNWGVEMQETEMLPAWGERMKVGDFWTLSGVEGTKTGSFLVPLQ